MPYVLFSIHFQRGEMKPCRPCQNVSLVYVIHFAEKCYETGLDLIEGYELFSSGDTVTVFHVHFIEGYLYTSHVCVNFACDLLLLSQVYVMPVVRVRSRR